MHPLIHFLQWISAISESLWINFESFARIINQCSGSIKTLFKLKIVSNLKFVIIRTYTMDFSDWFVARRRLWKSIDEKVSIFIKYIRPEQIRFILKLWSLPQRKCELPCIRSEWYMKNSHLSLTFSAAYTEKLPFQLRKSLFRALISEDHGHKDMLYTQEMSFRKLA